MHMFLLNDDFLRIFAQLWEYLILGLTLLRDFFFFFNIRRLCFIVAIVGVHFHWTCSGVTSPADSLLLLLFVDLWGWPVWLVGFDLPLFWLVFLQQLGMLCIYSWGGGLLLFFLVSLWGKFTAAIDFLRLCCVWNLFLQPPPWEISCGQLSLTETPGLVN